MIVRMLELKIARGHVSMGPDFVFGRIDLMFLIILINDLDAEGLLQGIDERFVEQGRVIALNEAHFLGELKIEVKDFTVVTGTDRVVDMAVWDGYFIRVLSVDFGETRVSCMI